MKNTLKVLSLAMAMLLCIGALVACGANEAEPTQKATETQPVVTTIPTETEPFVAPPDAIGKVVSVDNSLITWNVYNTSEDTIDFMGVKIKELGKPAEEMTLYYIEGDVTFYLVADGKLSPATYEDAVAGSIIGVTTLEEGVLEVYILYVPVEDDGSGEYIDSVEEPAEDTIPATTAAPEEEATPDEGIATDATEEPTEDISYTEPPMEEPSVGE